MPSPPAPSPSLVPVERVVQARVLEDARRLYASGEYRAAGRLLGRLIESPQSPIQLEARLLLGHILERDGLWRQALRHYEAVASSDVPAVAEEAAASGAAIRERLGPEWGEEEGVSGQWVHPAEVPSSEQVDRWLAGLAARGVRIIVLDVAPSGRRTGSRNGVYFYTTLAPVIRDLVSQLRPGLHRHRIQLIGAVTLDGLDWLEPHLGWREPGAGGSGQGSLLDLFHPAVREYLAAFVADLATSGLDGLLLQTARTTARTVSPYARNRFEREFGMRLDPTVLGPPADGRTSAVYWRWVGWKARERAELLARLVRTAHRMVPRLRVGIELHPAALIQPLQALIEHEEDALELKRTGADVFFVRSEVGEAAGPLLPRAAALLQDLDRLWIGLPAGIDEHSRPPDRRPRWLPTGVGLITRVPARVPA